MTILSRLFNFENKGVHDAKNLATPELLKIQMNAKRAREKAEDTARHMKNLERDLKKLTAYKVAIATGRINNGH